VIAVASPVLKQRFCTWCGRPLPLDARADARFCLDREPDHDGRKCRQSAFRARRRGGVAPAGTTGQASATSARAAAPDDGPMRFAYADPPYPGRAWKYYRDEEVDHEQLIARLEAGGYDGWALSTAADRLVDVLPLCPRGARVCAWTKPIGASTRTFGLHNCWEPLIVVGGRRRRPGKRDWLSAQPARHGGTLSGRKPIAFCAWLLVDCLGMLPGDELEDLFPGTGIVGRVWRELSSVATTATGDGSERRAAA
jgi:hypothetical protein